MSTHNMREVPKVDADAVDADGVGRAPAVQAQRQLVERGGVRGGGRGGPAPAPSPRAEREGLRVARAHAHPRVVRARPALLLAQTGRQTTFVTHPRQQLYSIHRLLVDRKTTLLHEDFITTILST